YSSRRSRHPANPDRPTAYAAVNTSSAPGPRRGPRTRSSSRRRRLPAHGSLDPAWNASASPSSCRRLAEHSVQQFLGERYALELEQLQVRFQPAVQGKSDLPGTREHIWILDRSFVHQVIRAHRRVAFDDVQLVRVKVAGPIEPRFRAR